MNKQKLAVAAGLSLTLFASASMASIKDECESSAAGLHALEVCPVIQVMIDQFAAYSPPATFVETSAMSADPASLNYEATARDVEKPDPLGGFNYDF